MENRAKVGHNGIRSYATDFRPLFSTEDFVHAKSTISYPCAGQVEFPAYVPIHWLNGRRVSDNCWDSWDGRWDSHEPRAWTGSSQNGYRNFAVGNDWVRAGVLRNKYEVEEDTRRKEESHRLYALSQVFTVDHVGAQATFGLWEELAGYSPIGPTKLDKSRTVEIRFRLEL